MAQSHRLWISLIGLTLTTVACPSETPSGNPFDPATPPENQAPAQLSVQVRGSLEDGTTADLENAALVLLASDATVLESAVTAADGTHAFPARAPGRFTLEISHATHLRQIREVVLEPGAELLLPVTLDRRAANAGDTSHVFGQAQRRGELARPPSEQDHSGILVEVEGAGVRTVTARDGRFDLFLTPATYDLVFSTRDYDLSRRDGVVATAGDFEIPSSPVILDPNPGRIVGTVRREGVTDPVSHGGVSVSIEGGTTVTSADDGSFAIADLAAGPYTLVARATGFETLRVGGVTVVAGNDVDLGTLDLILARGTIEGTVLLAGAADHAGTLVTLDGGSHATQTTNDGRFTLVGLPEGVHNLTARRTGFLSGPITGVTVTGRTTTTAAPITLAAFQVGLTLAGGAASVSDPELGVALLAPDAAEYQLSEDPTFAGETWPGMVATTNHLLTGADGLRTLHARFRASDGTISPTVSAGIRLDTRPPQLGAIRVGDGSIYVTDPSAQAILYATCSDEGGGSLALRVDATPGGTLYDGAYSPQINIDLGSTDQTISLIVTCTDDAGNSVSTPAFDIILDRAPPVVGTFSLSRTGPAIGPADKTNLRHIDVTLDVSDTPAGGVRTSLAETAMDCSRTTYDLPPTGVVSHILSAGDGVRSLFLCAMDAAGNFSATAVSSDNTLTLDTQGPLTPALVRDSLTNTFATLRWTTPPDTDLAGFEVELALEGIGQFVPHATAAPADTAYVDPLLPAEMGLSRTYRIAAVDDIGNRGGWSIELDAGVPFDPPTGYYANALLDVERTFGWESHPGTFTTIGSYTFEVAGVESQVPLSATLNVAALGSREVGGVEKRNERVNLLSSNRDGSLTWGSVFEIGIRTSIVDTEAPQQFDAARAPNGDIHLAWRRASGELVTLRVGDASPTVVDPDPGSLVDLNLVVDDLGTLHLAYGARPAGARIARYARIDGTGTTLLDLDDGTFLASPSSVCVDADSNGVAYYGLRQQDLDEFHVITVDASCIAGGFGACTVQVVDTGGGAGTRCSVVVDANDTVHLLHRHQLQDTFKYATLGNPWSVIDGGAFGQNLGFGLAVDLGGRPHFLTAIAISDSPYLWEYRYTEGSPACLADPAQCIPVPLTTSPSAYATRSYDLEHDPSSGLLWAGVEDQLIRIDADCKAGLGCETTPLGGYDKPRLVLRDTGEADLAAITSEGILWMRRDGAPVRTPLSLGPDDVRLQMGRGPDERLQVIYHHKEGATFELHHQVMGEALPRIVHTGEVYETSPILFDATGIPHTVFRGTLGPALYYQPLDGSSPTVTLTDAGNACGKLVGFDASGSPTAIYGTRQSSPPSCSIDPQHLVLDAACLGAPASGCSPTSFSTPVFNPGLGVGDAAGNVHFFNRVSTDLYYFKLTPECLAGTATCTDQVFTGPEGSITPSHSLLLAGPGPGPDKVLYQPAASFSTGFHRTRVVEGPQTGSETVYSEIPRELWIRSSKADAAGRTHVLTSYASTPLFYQLLGVPLPAVTLAADDNCELDLRPDGHAALLCRGRAWGTTVNYFLRGFIAGEVSPSIQSPL